MDLPPPWIFCFGLFWKIGGGFVLVLVCMDRYSLARCMHRFCLYHRHGYGPTDQVQTYVFENIPHTCSARSQICKSMPSASQTVKQTSLKMHVLPSTFYICTFPKVHIHNPNLCRQSTIPYSHPLPFCFQFSSLTSHQSTPPSGRKQPYSHTPIRPHLTIHHGANTFSRPRP